MSHASRARGQASRRFLPAAILAIVAALAVSAMALARTTAHAASSAVTINSAPWGTTTGGTPVRIYTLSNGHMRVRITNFGGVIQSIDVPGRKGRLQDVTLGFSSLAGYEANDVYPQPSGGSGTTYFGATVGRYANRIANGKFTLDGHTYALPKNNGPNTLHGGPNSWNSQVWTPTVIRKTGSATLSLTYVSANGQDGFPGTVTATVAFTLGRTNALKIHYHATTDAPTVINMTNHSYFNLGGQASGTVYNQLLKINANSYTPTDDTQIPTGQIAPVAGTPLDFRHFKAIGKDIRSPFHQLVLAHGYDHNYVINGGGSGGLKLAAEAVDPATGRTLTTYTDQPGVQLYTGNFLVGELVGTTGQTYRQSDGFTLETQHFPNSPNQPSFPSTTLNPGTPFNSTTVYTFGVTG